MIAYTSSESILPNFYPYIEVLMNRLTPVVEKIIIANTALFIIHKLFGLDLINLLGLRYVYSPQFMPYQIITHLFVHASFGHLFSNMFTLISFGPILEMHLSSKRFLIFYLVTGIGAALLYMGVLHLEINQFESFYTNYLNSPTPEKFSLYMQKPSRFNREGFFVADESCFHGFMRILHLEGYFDEYSQNYCHF